MGGAAGAGAPPMPLLVLFLEWGVIMLMLFFDMVWYNSLLGNCETHDARSQF